MSLFKAMGNCLDENNCEISLFTSNLPSIIDNKHESVLINKDSKEEVRLQSLQQ